MEYPEYVKEVNSFDDLQKLSIYMDYFITMNSLTHNFEIVDKKNFNWNYNMRKPDKEYHDVAIYYLWKDLKISSFHDFISDRNIEIRENYISKKPYIQTFGIYEWYWKNKEKFNFKN